MYSSSVIHSTCGYHLVHFIRWKNEISYKHCVVNKLGLQGCDFEFSPIVWNLEQVSSTRVPGWLVPQTGISWIESVRANFIMWSPFLHICLPSLSFLVFFLSLSIFFLEAHRFETSKILPFSSSVKLIHLFAVPLPVLFFSLSIWTVCVCAWQIDIDLISIFVFIPYLYLRQWPSLVIAQ